jgi:hypothetical protein
VTPCFKVVVLDEAVKAKHESTLEGLEMDGGLTSDHKVMLKVVAATRLICNGRLPETQPALSRTKLDHGPTGLFWGLIL